MSLDKIKETVKTAVGKVNDFTTRAHYSTYCPYCESNCDMNKCPCAKYQAYEAAQDQDKVQEVFNELGVDMNLQPWELMMAMQNKFAAKFHKVEGLTKDEVDYWNDKYLICIEDEIREVREHLSIYPEDQDNEKKMNEKELKKEIIDILHFVMDLYICGNANYKDIEKAYLKLYAPEVESTCDLLKFAYRIQQNTTYFKDDNDILLLVNKLLDCGGAVRQQISWKHWKKPAAEINYEKLYEAYAKMFETLVNLFMLFMTPDEIKDVYVKKNIENILRQKFGY